MPECFDLRESGGVAFLEAAPLTATGLCVAACSTRLGGVSSGPYASLNLGGRSVADDPACVRENRLRFARALGIDARRQVVPRQVHGAGVLAVPAGLPEERAPHSAPDGEPAREPHREPDMVWRLDGEGDALVTAEPGPVLTVTVADCAPVYLLDPVRRAVGLAHAGWRGTVAGAAPAALAEMARLFGTRPRDCLAVIGPCIGPCCYEVDDMVIRPLAARTPRWREAVRERAGGRWALDLKAANAAILAEAGVPERNIFRSAYCTACRRDLFYSHRGEGGVTGRMAAVIALRAS